MDKISTLLPERLIEENLDILIFWAKDLPDEYAQQLIEKSRQPHVLKFEGHEDAEGRFKDLDSYREWANQKSRLIYLLVHKEEDNKKPKDVGGIIWFGPRGNESIDKKYELTFGIRLYEGCVGKGLSKPFMRATHGDLERFYPGKYIWLDFAQDNIAAQKAYESFGYEYLKDDGDRVIMGYPRG